MRFVKNMSLDYVEPAVGKNLYDGVDLEAEDCVEARYWKQNGYPGNPDICALPRAADINELFKQNNIPIPGYDPAKVKMVPLSERKRRLISLKKIRYPIPFHSLIEYHLSMALISSYASRRNGITAITRPTKVAGEEIATNIISYTNDISANVLGFSVVGTSGVGKSTAFDLTCAKYPRVIRHTFPDGFYTQIPIIRLTAFANSNLTALFLSFAKQLDRLLDTGTDHLNMVSGKANLGKIVSIVCGWIEVYHIGVIAIDEIQFLDFSQGSAKSFENFLTITAQTGVAIVAIGTPEACRLWGSMLRIQRRMASTIIRADSYCKNKKYMSGIIERIWKYQWLDEPATLTEEIENTMYEESCGSIDLLTTLWMMMQFEVLSKEEQPTIDEVFVHKVAEKHIREMRGLLKESLVENEQRFLKLRENMLMDIQQSALADEERKAAEAFHREAKENIDNHYDRDLILSQMMESISDCYPEYSELQIRKAFAKAEQEDGFKKAAKGERVQRVLAVLKKVGKEKRRTIGTKQAAGDDGKMKEIENTLMNCIEKG